MAHAKAQPGAKSGAGDNDKTLPFSLSPVTTAVFCAILSLKLLCFFARSIGDMDEKATYYLKKTSRSSRLSGENTLFSGEL